MHPILLWSATMTISASDRASSWLNDFESAQQKNDVAATLALFDEECYWRDLVSYTWNIKTVESKQQIADMLQATLKTVKPSHFKL
jgi:putative flavoprotein involved in K+ transport